MKTQHLALLSKRMKKKRTHINRLRNQQRNIIIDTKETHNILRNSFRNLCSLAGKPILMDEFLDSGKPPHLNQDYVSNLKRPITTEEI